MRDSPRRRPGSTDAFVAAMDDDFDTPAGVAVLFETRPETRTTRSATRVPTTPRRSSQPCASSPGALGIEIDEREVEADDEIEALVDARDDARARKDFAEADRIREQLLERGIVLEDTPYGTVWRRG